MIVQGKELQRIQSRDPEPEPDLPPVIKFQFSEGNLVEVQFRENNSLYLQSSPPARLPAESANKQKCYKLQTRLYALIIYYLKYFESEFTDIYDESGEVGSFP